MNIPRRTPEFHCAQGVRSNSSPLLSAHSRPHSHHYEQQQQQTQYNTPSKYFYGQEAQQPSYKDDESISDASTVRSHQQYLNDQQQSPSSVDGSYASSDSVPSSLFRERTLSQCSVNVSPLRTNFEDVLSSPPLYERYASLQISKPTKQLVLWGEDFDALHSKQNQSRTRKTSAVYQQLINSSYMRRYRSVVCDWFFEIQYAVSILQRTVHVATFYMDLCMYKLYSENRVVGGSATSENHHAREGLFNIKQYLQLLAACCLWIATKRDETYGDSKLKLDNLIQYCCHMYTKQEFQQMEIFVLDLLEWELEDTPSIDFLETMLTDNRNRNGLYEDDSSMKDEEDVHFVTFKETVKQYSSMVMDASLLGTLSIRQSNDSLEQLKRHFNIIVPCHLEHHFEHTYISMWITMLNYPSLMALSSLLLGLFLYHQYDAPFDSGQIMFENQYQPSVNSYRLNQQSESSTELFDEVLTHYWTIDMEEHVGYTLEQVAICARILYTFFQREQEHQNQEAMNEDQSLHASSQAHCSLQSQQHEITTVHHHESHHVRGLDPCYDLVCDEQL